MQFIKEWAGPVWIVVCLQLAVGSVVIAAVAVGKL